MKKILITGCSGFLGSNLADVLKMDKKNILYGFTEIHDCTLEGVTVRHMDIRNREGVFGMVEDVQPDLTFHLAAVSNVGFSWKHTALTYEINFIGSANLIEALAQFSPGSRIVLMSTAELYSEGKLSPYSLSKKAMEMLGDLYINSKGMDILKIRSFNFSGPGQAKQFVASDFACQIAEIERGEREPVIEVGNLSAIRDFSDVRDIARYLNVIGERGNNGDIYNLCSGKKYAIEEILDILLSFSEKKIKVVVNEKKFRPIDTPILAGDPSVLWKKFNLKPEFNIKQTLLDLLNFWRSFK